MPAQKKLRAPAGAVRLHVKAGDTVEVISGNDKGQAGLVLETYPRRSRVLVQGVNKRWKHAKPTQQNPKGERVQKERPIHASNVKLVTAAPSHKRGA